jgi:hypothetical protein
VQRLRRDLASLPRELDARYTALVAAVAPAIEAALSPAVSANRVLVSGVRPPVLRLAPWRAERSAFVRRLSALAATGTCLALADVRDCYGSIRAGVVERALRRLGCRRNEAAAVAGFLQGVSALGVRGLPVGPDPSAVLANAVLAKVDSALESAGARHLRWVDDVVVAVDHPEAARRVVATVADALGPLGLSLNDAKTRVVLDPRAVERAGTLSMAGSPSGVG